MEAARVGLVCRVGGFEVVLGSAARERRGRQLSLVLFF